MVFMVASTNLVIELGAVLLVLMGWQFAVSEFVGGAIMIALLAVLGGLWLRGKFVVEARTRLAAAEARPGEHQHSAEQDWRKKVRTKGGWADAAGYTMSDLTMIRRELLVGYVAAGFVVVLVPVTFWNDIFVHGHGFWTSVENVIVGPFIAVISFVCSIGNVPLAAALWKGGISFGGIISFIFADLLTFPLLLIFRRYYGTRLMLRMVVVLWAVMSLAGLVTEGIFRAAGIVPAVHRVRIVSEHFSWNYTTYLNILFLAAFGVLHWANRNRDRLGGGSGTARDPFCGMQVEIAHAPASLVHAGERVYFCSDRCRQRFNDASGQPQVAARD
jgi:uncharacterized protein